MSFLLGIFAPNRLSSLEAMFVVQYAFISLIWFPKYLALPFYCLINLKYSTAYNYPFLKPTPTAVVPPQLYTLGLSASSFYSNVNFCCVVFVIAWIGLVVSKILVNVKGSKIEEERRSLKDTFTRD